MMPTPMTEMFGMQWPILGGGMMWLSDARYVAALARAGALGFITPRSFEGLPAFRDALKTCRDACDGRPFGVNITQSRRPNENRLVAQWIEIGLEEGASCFETVGASPGALFAQIHAGGARAIHKCAFVEHALKAQEAGADAIVLVGCEAGGHPGTNPLSAFVLGALGLQALRVPLAIGGGIGSGRQIAAALALGADAVLMGTRFLVCDEIWAHDRYKRHLSAQPAQASTLALQSTGNPWRVLDNATVRQTRQMEADGACQYPEFGALATGRFARDAAYESGDWERGLLSMGPAVGFADRQESVDQVVRRLMSEAVECMNRLSAISSTELSW